MQINAGSPMNAESIKCWNKRQGPYLTFPVGWTGYYTCPAL